MRYSASIRAAATIAATCCVFLAGPPATGAVRSLKLGDRPSKSLRLGGMVETIDRAAFATALEGVAPTFDRPLGHDVVERVGTCHPAVDLRSSAAAIGRSSAP